MSTAASRRDQMLRRRGPVPPTPCPVVDDRHYSMGGGVGDDDDEENNTTANIDFTTQFKASFRNVKPRRPPKSAATGLRLAAATKAVAPRGSDTRPSTSCGRDGLGFEIHQDEECTPTGNEATDVTLPAVPSPTMTRPARRRRGTIYIPHDETTMPTVYMGVFSPLKSGHLRQHDTVREEDEQVVDEATGLAAVMLEKMTKARPTKPLATTTTTTTTAKKKPVLVASPRRGYRCRPPSLPLGESKRCVQAAPVAEAHQGSGPGKENIPPGYVQQQQKKDEESMMMKKPRKSTVAAAAAAAGAGRRAQQQVPPQQPSRPSINVLPPVKPDKVESAKSFPLLPDGLPEVSLYEDNWLGQQEVAITQLLNSLFEASSSSSPSSTSAVPGQLRSCLLDEYNKADVVLLHKRVQGALLYGSLSMPEQAQGHRPYDDLGRRKAFTDLWLETYDGELLKTALEVVTGRAINVDSTQKPVLKKRLKLFIEVFLMRNEDLSGDEADGRCYQYGRTVLRSLMLIKVLDLAKTAESAKALSTPTPRLFLPTSPHKTSSSVLTALMHMLNASVGDPVRALAHLGYVVWHEQHALAEYEYAITNLAVDLRDGVRLARLVELLVLRRSELSPRLRLPCIGRATKLFNVQIALSALAKATTTDLDNIRAEDIVDGFREKTMRLLWSLTCKWGLARLLDWSDVRCEIGRLRRAAGRVGQSTTVTDDGDNDDYAGLLQAWARAVGVLYGLTVRNLTTSFADGRVFEAIVDHYSAYLPTTTTTRTTRTALSDRLAALGCSEPFARLFARGPGATRQHHHGLFDRDFTLASLAFLGSRLLGPSRRARAAAVLQRAWRRRWHGVVLPRRAARLQRLARECADAVRRNEASEAGDTGDTRQTTEVEEADLWLGL